MGQFDSPSKMLMMQYVKCWVGASNNNMFEAL